MKRRATFIILATALAGHAWGADRRVDPSAYIPMGSVADAPWGFTDMCRSDPTACVADRTATTDSTDTAGVGASCTSIAAPLDQEAALVAEPVHPQPIPPHAARSEACAAPAPGRNAVFSSAAIRTGQTTNPLSSPPSTSDLDDRSLNNLVKQINRRVNRNVRQVSDMQLYGVDELWRAAGSEPGAAGDCEDIALEKRNELIRAGMPADDLFLATVFVEGIGLHTVMVARLQKGDFVLDSLAPEVVRWNHVGYTWLRIQSPEHPMEWHRLGRT